MKYILCVLAMCVVTVSCQRSAGSPSAPRAPISAGGNSKPVRPAQSQISPPRPKGCSPGCGAAEICAELGESYCRAGQICFVCIKMSSIRFTTSALASMLSSQLNQPRQQQQQKMQQQSSQSVMPVIPDSNQQANINSLLPFMFMDGFGLGLGF